MIMKTFIHCRSIANIGNEKEVQVDVNRLERERLNALTEVQK
jgi:hypothetical protein